MTDRVTGSLLPTWELELKLSPTQPQLPAIGSEPANGRSFFPPSDSVSRCFSAFEVKVNQYINYCNIHDVLNPTKMDVRIREKSELN